MASFNPDFNTFQQGIYSPVAVSVKEQQELPLNNRQSTMLHPVQHYYVHSEEQWDSYDAPTYNPAYAVQQMLHPLQPYHMTSGENEDSYADPTYNSAFTIQQMLHPIQPYNVEAEENWDSCDDPPHNPTLDIQKVLHPVQPYHVETGENWDSCDDPTYNPTLDIQQKRVLIHPPVNASRSAKKAFYAQERKRWNQLKNKTK